ncbi:hypothetical protein JOF53_005631 [Crossiella equi]|uniref:DUF3558 domain-containing protein n=1 Tax=Crossiella equi TaxID=130796 RepID=A0ABS5AJL1_9PSEU|nr:DUF3558 family protein [Crossiella equi]MBP2476759.1 hypothetical protein [Crossiella equi]
MARPSAHLPVLACAVALTACTTSPTTTASPSPFIAEVPAPATLLKDWARVPTPKTVDKGFRLAPCDALTSKDRQELDLAAPPVPSVPGAQPGCTWRNRTTGAEVTLELDPLSLAQRYDTRPPNLTPRNGYPSLEEPSGQGCHLRIGVSLTEALSVTARPCHLAAQVAERVTGKLPAGT